MRWESTVTIEAPADRVWQLNVEVESWPAITPTTMQRVERLDDGPFGLGSSARIKQPGQTSAVWTVTRFEDGREFAWQTKRMGMVMTGTHRLEDLGGRRHNTLVLEVTGPGSGIFGRVIGPLLRKTIATENACFKREAERIHRVS
jgi:uncharacterized membrane protein